jgi:uncharacterized protein (TIGR01777 family)
MKVLISGSHGLVGSALAASLAGAGHEVFSLVRHSPKSPKQIEWHPNQNSLTTADLESMDAVVHLAGESIASGRWTDEKKQAIRDSRIKSTKLLAEALDKLNTPPATLINASAIGYYGDRGDEILNEESAPGNDFLARVCAEWEEATEPAVRRNIRVVKARFGVILSTEGGALKKMLTPFRLGVGGKVGSGKQWMSWIALEDVIGGLRFVLDNEALSGPVNFVAPNPVTNAEFTRALGSALSRPTIFSVPAFGARLAFGEMADALLLASQRVKPEELQKAGYEFKQVSIESALTAALAE